MTSAKTNEFNMTAVVLIDCTSQVFKIIHEKPILQMLREQITPMEIIIA